MNSKSLSSYHVQQGLVVPEGSHHAHQWHREHHQAQQDEHYSWRQEEPLQGSILLPFHFGVHPHTQHTKTHQLQTTEAFWDKNLQELQRDGQKAQLRQLCFRKFSNFTGVAMSVIIYKDHLSRRTCGTSTDCGVLESAVLKNDRGVKVKNILKHKL